MFNELKCRAVESARTSRAGRVLRAVPPGGPAPPHGVRSNKLGGPSRRRQGAGFGCFEMSWTLFPPPVASSGWPDPLRRTPGIHRRVQSERNMSEYSADFEALVVWVCVCVFVVGVCVGACVCVCVVVVVMLGVSVFGEWAGCGVLPLCEFVTHS